MQEPEPNGMELSPTDSQCLVNDLIRKFHSKVTSSDRKLVDDDINTYMHLLNEKYGANGMRKFMDVSFITSLMCRGVENLDSKKATRFIMQLFHNEMTVPDLVVIPVHILEIHWGLLAIIFGSRHILGIDSFDSKHIVSNKQHTVFSMELKRHFEVIIQLFRKWKGKYQFNHLFKNPIPWVYVRTAQLQHQTDDTSCGYFLNLAARVIGSAKNVSQMCAFNFKDLPNLKRLVDIELQTKRLVEDLDELDMISITGMDKTRNFRIIYLTNFTGGVVKMQCVLNPSYISYKTLSNYLKNAHYSTEFEQEYLGKISTLRDGNTLALIIQSKERHFLKLQYILSGVFNLITKHRLILTHIDIQEIAIILQSDIAREIIDSRTPTVALELDWKNNYSDMSKSKLDTVESRIVYDLIACYFHSMCKLCRKLSFLVINNETISNEITSLLNRGDCVTFTFTSS